MEQIRLLFTFKEAVGATALLLKMLQMIAITELKPILGPLNSLVKLGIKGIDSLETLILT
jgi:hypothetical protein